jgi:hypothetical protein
MQEYIGAGDFTARERFMRALRNNVPFLILYFIAFIVIVIVLAVTESGRKALQR